jgi:hypothetical protein
VHIVEDPVMVPAEVGSTVIKWLVRPTQPVAGSVTVYTIVTVSTEMPVTTPAALTTATDASRLLQTPPETVSASVLVLARQTQAGPEITPGSTPTCTVCVCWQPPVVELLLRLYVISTVPKETPVTTPVVGFTVAIAGLPELHAAEGHVLPDVASVSVIVLPTQTAMLPVIAAGVVITVTVPEQGTTPVVGLPKDQL